MSIKRQTLSCSELKDQQGLRLIGIKIDRLRSISKYQRSIADEMNAQHHEISATSNLSIYCSDGGSFVRDNLVQSININWDSAGIKINKD